MNHRRNPKYFEVKPPRGAVPRHPPREGGLCFRSAATSVISVPTSAPKIPSTTQPAPKHTASSGGQWRSPWASTFKPTDGSSPQENTSQDHSTSNAEEVDLYDPYDPLSSESESELAQRKRCDRNSPKRDVDHRSHWEMAQPKETGAQRWDRGAERRECGAERRDRSAERRDRSAERRDRSAERRDRDPDARLPTHGSLSPSGSQHRRASSTGVPRTYDQICYDPVRPNERSSPEEHSLRAERVPEFATNVGLSTPNFPADDQLQKGYCETGGSSVNMASPREIGMSSRAITVKDVEQQSAFTCELCEVECAGLEGLREHLESRGHWNTMEHIQQLNHYDDLTMAFLQEVMMFKVRQCCSAMVDQDIEALKETDHMSRVDVLHCAVCSVYISTSATSVKNHVASMEHLHNKKSFSYRQKQECLDKAAVMITQLKPQFEQYRQGGNPFE
ncbi:unnamed protein product [Arctogadus glacialis]